MKGAERLRTKIYMARGSDDQARCVGEIQIQGTYLARLGRLLRNLECRLGAVRKEVALDVEYLRGLHERRDLGRRQVSLVELLRRGEGRDERAMVAGDDDRARARLLTLRHLIDLVKALALVRRLELLREVVVADAPRIDHRVWGQDVLCKYGWESVCQLLGGGHGCWERVPLHRAPRSVPRRLRRR